MFAVEKVYWGGYYYYYYYDYVHSKPHNDMIMHPIQCPPILPTSSLPPSLQECKATPRINWEEGFPLRVSDSNVATLLG